MLFESEPLNYISIFRASREGTYFGNSFIGAVKTVINDSIDEYKEIRKKISSSSSRLGNKYLYEFIKHDKQYQKLIMDARDCHAYIRNTLLEDESYSHFESPFAIGKIYSFDSCLRMYTKPKIQLYKLELDHSVIKITAVFKKKEIGKSDYYSIFVNYQDALHRPLSFGLFLNMRNSSEYVNFTSYNKTSYLHPGKKCIGYIKLSHRHLVNEPNNSFYFAMSIKICNDEIKRIKGDMIDSFLNNLSK